MAPQERRGGPPASVDRTAALDQVALHFQAQLAAERCMNAARL
jgi:hypothetical protein